MNLFDKEMGVLLKTYREQKKMSQQDVADRLGLSRSAICNYETGIRSIDIATLYKVCDVYNIDINEDVFQKVKKYVYKK